jgi:hypothetical protein
MQGPQMKGPNSFKNTTCQNLEKETDYLKRPVSTKVIQSITIQNRKHQA